MNFELRLPSITGVTIRFKANFKHQSNDENRVAIGF
jgi:hypothetical protein